MLSIRKKKFKGTNNSLYRKFGIITRSRTLVMFSLCFCLEFFYFYADFRCSAINGVTAIILTKTAINVFCQRKTHHAVNRVNQRK